MTKHSLLTENNVEKMWKLCFYSNDKMLGNRNSESLPWSGKGHAAHDGMVQESGTHSLDPICKERRRPSDLQNCRHYRSSMAQCPVPAMSMSSGTLHALLSSMPPRNRQYKITQEHMGSLPDWKGSAYSTEDQLLKTNRRMEMLSTIPTRAQFTTSAVPP